MGVQIAKRISLQFFFSNKVFKKFQVTAFTKVGVRFSKFWIWKFLRQIEIFVNMGPQGQKVSK